MNTSMDTENKMKKINKDRVITGWAKDGSRANNEKKGYFLCLFKDHGKHHVQWVRKEKINF